MRRHGAGWYRELDRVCADLVGIRGGHDAFIGGELTEYIRVGYLRDMDGVRMKSFRMLGRVVAVVRDRDGGLWATEIACKHQNADLVTEGRWNGDLVICKRHGWQYDLRSGKCLNQNSAPLRRHALKVIAGELHVSVHPIEEDEAGEDEPMPEIVIRPKGSE